MSDHSSDIITLFKIFRKAKKVFKANEYKNSYFHRCLILVLKTTFVCILVS